MGSINTSETTEHGERKIGKIEASLNEELNNVEWGEYKLGGKEGLFTIEGTKSLDSNAISFTKDGINFVGRTSTYNGIQGKIQLRDFPPNEAFTITATVIGNYKYVKYQEEPYYCSQNINKLTPNPILGKWNKYIAYYFIANIQRFVSLYDGQQGGYKLDDIESHKIMLPVKDGKINFSFMEKFIAELEEQRVAELEAYLSVTGLKNYELTDDEQKVIKDYSDIEFRDYDITKIFDINNTKNILSREVEENSGNVPYLCASSENNSISTYISYNESLIDKGNCIFIGGKTFVVTYQKDNFYSNDSHNLALYLKNYPKSRLTYLYLATCVYKSLNHKYSWGNSVSGKKIQKDVISLPIKNGNVDYGKMSVLISAIQKLVIKDVVLYSDSKISATKAVINQ